MTRNGRNVMDIRKAVLTLVVAAAAAVAATPVSVGAQTYAVREVPRGWLGISYDETIVIRSGQRTGSVTITEVAKGSPAERAGVLVGDTLVKLNNFRATSDVLRSMGASVEPGDTVHVSVRRGGRDRNISIVVAKRPMQTFATTTPGGRVWTYDPDSVRGMMRIFVDSMVAGLDTSKMRMFRIDTTHMMSVRGDSMFASRLPSAMFGRVSGIPMDTLIRRGDVPFIARADLPPGVTYDVHTPDMVFRSFARGESAFAGAGLADMNPDLSEYFGTKTGVLVLNVPAGTPAATAGLEAGDIVTKVDGTPVTSVTDLRRVVEKAKRGAPIKLDIVRHQKARTVELNRDR